MSILSDFEDRLGGAIEGAFSTVFRSPVQPAELARRAGKEMAKSKKLGPGRIYVANVYSIFISPADARTLGGLTQTLEGELETYLLAYSREHDYHLTTRPVVRFATDDALKLGKFDVVGEQMSVAEILEELGPVPGVTDDLEDGPVEAPSRRGAGVSPVIPSAPAAADDGTCSPSIAAATITLPEGRRVTLDRARVYRIGRSREVELCVEDKNASRVHAELSYDGDAWQITDLGSTNGTQVNERAVKHLELRDGDRIVVGISRLTFNAPPAPSSGAPVGIR
ncbi:MAG: DUF3662 and FHA domain-containing protein [Actinomycetes bacterium]|nr:DUF3662 and FHA domain-containing protein [Actinomycetes bacterium]